MICGVLCTSSKIIYGFNKKGMHMKKFMPFDFGLPSIIVPTKYPLLSYDMYAIIKCTDLTIGPNVIGLVEQYVGKIGDLHVERQFIKYSRNINTKKYNKDLWKDYTKDNYSCRVVLNNYIISIDPDNCKDIDDAIHIDVFDTYYEIGIHIADVSAFIKQDSILDTMIQNRASSIYLHDEIIHMLPLELVSMYSLTSGEPKKALSLIIKMDKENNILSYNFTRTIINIAHNLSYDEATNLDLDIIKRMAIISNTSDPHKMVEYFMVLANKIVAEHLISKNVNCILRTQDIGPATYTYSNSGAHLAHSSLNLKYYTHYTSPIRRYVDIVTHRLLEGCTDIDLDKLNKKVRQINKAQNDSIRLNIIDNIHNNYNNILVSDAKILYFEDNTIFLEIIGLNIRAIFKMFPNKIKKTLKYESSHNILKIQDIILEANSIIKIKIITCMLTPFVSKKLKFQIISPELLYL